MSLRHYRPHLLLEWRDIWVGVYVGKDAVYVCLIPCVVLKWCRS